jgi:hypothetical protein
MGDGRVTRRLTLPVILLFLVVTLTTGLATAAAQSQTSAAAGGSDAKTLISPPPAEPLADRVVIVVLSGMTWDDLDLKQAYGVRAAFESGWAANMNIATLGEQRTLARTLTSLGSAVRADAGPEAAEAMNADERIENGKASDVYLRRTSRLPGRFEVFHLGQPALVRANVGAVTAVTPGLLGAVVSSLGRGTAVYGNGDESMVGSGGTRRREAAVLAMDQAGRVARGDVGGGTLVSDSEMADGVRTNTALLLYRVSTLPKSIGLVVLDVGDTARAARMAPSATPAALRFAKARALSRASDLLDRLILLTGEEAAIVLVAPPVEEATGGKPVMSPFAILMPGARPGYATSGSTRRPGLVSGTDLIRTVRYVLGGVDPADGSIPGRPIVRFGGTTKVDVTKLERDANRASTVWDGRWTVSWIWFVLQIVGAAVAVFLLRSRTDDETASRLTEALMLWLVAAPLSCLVLAWIWPFAVASVRTFAVLSLVPAVILAAGLALTGMRPSRQLQIVYAATAVALLLDQLEGIFIGPRLVMDTAFGYSTVEGGRYYGIGNEGMSILFVAVALGLGLWLDQQRVDWARAKWGVGALLAAVALVVGLPFIGANLGGVIAVTAGFATMWLGWDGKRPTLRMVTAVAIVVVVLAGGLVAVDMLRGSGQATHLAAAGRDVAGGGLAAASRIAARKLTLSLDIFRKNPAAWLVLAFIALMVVERRRPQGLIASMVADRPRFTTALTGVFVAGIVGGLIEDTGIYVPATMLGIALPSVLLLLLASARWRRTALEL